MPAGGAVAAPSAAGGAAVAAAGAAPAAAGESNYTRWMTNISFQFRILFIVIAPVCIAK